MERRIENSNHRSLRHQLLAGTDTDQVCRVVKRSQVVALLDSLDSLFRKQRGGRELLAAVYHTVSYGANLGKALNNARLLIGEGIQNHLDRLGVGRHRRNRNLFLAAGRLVSNLASLNSDSLAEALCKDCLCVGVDELVL